MYRDTVWSFSTKEFLVALEISPEEMDPADSFEFEDDINAVRNGHVEWFCARVAVYKNSHLVGSDTLGGCAYNTIEEFYTSHRNSDPMNRNCTIMRKKFSDKMTICHYFPSMVQQAIDDARTTLGLRTVEQSSKGPNSKAVW